MIVFLFASLVLHALCFYLFQIVYPPTVALLPPPGRVSLIAPNSEEGRVLLRWLEAEDPALASTTQVPADKKSVALPIVAHVASYQRRQPALKEISPPESDLRVPSAQPPAPVPAPPAKIETAGRTTPTVLRFSAEIEALGPVQSPELKFNAANREAPQVAQFRVAVNENGEMRHIFLETSSGDATLDEQARQYLALCRFSSIRNQKSEIGNELFWGTATVEWGNDVTATAPFKGGVAP